MPLYKAGIIDYTWATKPSVAPLGQIICITDVGENGSLWRGDGTKWVRMHGIRYYDLVAAVSVTGTTAETTLLSFTVKGGLIGVNGKMKIWPLLSMTNNANGKTIRLKMDGTVIYGSTRVSESHIQFLTVVRNTNSQSSQKLSAGITAGLGTTTAAVTTLAVDTSADFNISVTGQLTNAADSITLDGFFLEII